MKRLTQKNIDYCKDICRDWETWSDCYYYCNRDKLPKDWSGRCIEAIIYEKIQEFEDLEERDESIKQLCKMKCFKRK